MNPASVVILLLVLGALFFAIRSVKKHGAGKCGGDCAHCAARCGKREEKK